MQDNHFSNRTTSVALKLFVLLSFIFLFFDKDFAMRFSVMQNAFRPHEQTDHGLQAFE